MEQVLSAQSFLARHGKSLLRSFLPSRGPLPGPCRLTLPFLPCQPRVRYLFICCQPGCRNSTTSPLVSPWNGKGKIRRVTGVPSVIPRPRKRGRLSSPMLLRTCPCALRARASECAGITTSRTEAASTPNRARHAVSGYTCV